MVRRIRIQTTRTEQSGYSPFRTFLEKLLHPLLLSFLIQSRIHYSRTTFNNLCMGPGPCFRQIWKLLLWTDQDRQGLSGIRGNG